MVTDGCISYQKAVKRNYMSFGSIDYEWVYKIAKILCSNPTLYKKKNVNFWTISNCNNNFINWLLDNNCTPAKSINLNFPTKIPEKYMPDFIRGVMDGDGSIMFLPKSKTKKDKISKGKRIKAYICSSSLDFINGIKIWLDKNDFKYNFNVQEVNSAKTTASININGKSIIQRHDHYRVTVTHHTAYKLLKLIYYPENKLSLDRKQILANGIIDYYENEWSESSDGENNPAALLNNNQVKEIREAWSSGSFKTKSELIRHFQNNLKYIIKAGTFYDVLSGATFKNI